MRQRMMKAGVLLLGLMILFTIISRTAYNMSTAQVSTKKPEPQTFTTDVSARGTVTGREEIAVSAEESLRVKTVHVTEGQAVEAGQLLFEVDLQDLMEKMKEKQQELYSLDLQIQGAAESAAFSEKSRQLMLSQAQEDYN
ncbi:MAG: biotin/lipoyl-binding protein, partial [Schaedlerella arabinosiphila]|nr:biotin/lipoyl-binding protein [Schaedlerella arabinosiphila]